MAKATTHEIQAQTVAHIQREIAAVGAEIRERTERRVAIYQQRPPGAGPPEPVSPDLAAAHAFALERANGNAPASMRLTAASMDSDRQLAIEIAGLQIYAEVLQRQDMTARAAEVYQRAIDGADEWRELCRGILLTAERLIALENRARAFRAALGGSSAPDNLLLARFIGHHGSLIDHRPSVEQGFDLHVMPPEPRVLFLY